MTLRVRLALGFGRPFADDGMTEEKFMDYAISDSGERRMRVASAERSRSGGRPDEVDRLGARGSLVARANRHYVMGEFALAAGLLMEAKAPSYRMEPRSDPGCVAIKLQPAAGF